MKEFSAVENCQLIPGINEEHLVTLLYNDIATKHFAGGNWRCCWHYWCSRKRWSFKELVAGFPPSVAVTTVVPAPITLTIPFSETVGYHGIRRCAKKNIYYVSFTHAVGRLTPWFEGLLEAEFCFCGEWIHCHHAHIPSCLPGLEILNFTSSNHKSIAAAVDRCCWIIKQAFSTLSLKDLEQGMITFFQFEFTASPLNETTHVAMRQGHFQVQPHWWW